MKDKVDPKSYGLPIRTVLLKTGSDNFIIVINRKSRIIMKDAVTIFKKAETLRESVPSASVTLETTAPVCSKSIKFLKEHDVNVVLMRELVGRP